MSIATVEVVMEVEHVGSPGGRSDDPLAGGSNAATWVVGGSRNDARNGTRRWPWPS
jgi:hypothetical protein